MSDHWIQSAIKHHGAFRKKAMAAGKTTEEYAREQQHAPGVLGHQARLAMTLMHLHHNDTHGEDAPEPATEEKPHSGMLRALERR